MCLVTSQLALGLIECNLVRTRINLGQKVPRMHELSLAEANLEELAINSASHRHRVEGSHRSQTPQVNRHIPLLDRCHGNGNARGRRLPLSRCGLCLGATAQFVATECSAQKDRENQKPQPQAFT